jgi:hypothetical protein
MPQVEAKSGYVVGLANRAASFRAKTRRLHESALGAVNRNPNARMVEM